MGSDVVHFDISGPDPAQLASFYGEVFGWTITPMPGGMPYSTIDTNSNGEGWNGGIAPTTDDDPGRVTIYVSREDLQADLDRAVSLGGSVMLPVTDVPGVVRLAVFGDPAGNAVGMVAPVPERAGETAPRPSPGSGAPANWFEIMGTDAKVLVDFYTELFGWTVKANEMGGGHIYYEVHTTEGENSKGGIGSNPMGAVYATVYISPEDLEGTLAAAEEHGAKTLVPVMAVPNGPTIAMFTDPQGHIVGLYKGMAR